MAGPKAKKWSLRDRRAKPQGMSGFDTIDLAQPPSAWFTDPNAMMTQFSGNVPTNAHPGAGWITSDVLDSLARSPFAAPIISIRVNQVAEFLQRQPDRHSAGFKVMLRDPDREMTKAAKVRAREIEDMILAAGGKYGNGSFEAFGRALMVDSMVLDQANFEVLEDRAGRPMGFVAVDASTIRRARPSAAAAARGQTVYDPGMPSYVQVVDQKIVAEFDADQMAWGVRRPRTRRRYFGYGNPELAEVISVLTDLTNAQTYNSVNFSNGVNVNTMLAVMAHMNGPTWNDFQRGIAAKLSGVGNARRLLSVLLNPKLNEDIKPIKLGDSNRDMEFMQFIGFCLKLLCAGMQMDPAELGYVYGAEGQSSALSDKGPEERLVASKERGLRPKLRSFETWMNRWFVRRVDEDFKFGITGYDAVSREAKLKMDIDAVKSMRTINEIRAENDWPPIDKPWADMILDATVINSEMARMAQEQAEQEGAPDDDEMDGQDAGPDDDVDGDEPATRRGADPFASQGGDEGEEKGRGGMGMEKASRLIVDAIEQAYDEGRMGLLGAQRAGSRYKLDYDRGRMMAVEVR